MAVLGIPDCSAMKTLVLSLCALLLASCASQPPASVLTSKQATFESNVLRYYADWRVKTEHMGTLYYPSEVTGKIYGSVLATIQINADGTVESVKVDRSSGHKLLDEAVHKIVMLGAPYAPFSPELRREIDIVEFPCKFIFSRRDGAMHIGPRTRNQTTENQ